MSDHWADAMWGRYSGGRFGGGFTAGMPVRIESGNRQEIDAFIEAYRNRKLVVIHAPELEGLWFRITQCRLVMSGYNRWAIDAHIRHENPQPITKDWQGELRTDYEQAGFTWSKLYDFA